MAFRPTVASRPDVADAATAGPADVAAALGRSVLAQVLTRTPDGIVVVDANRRCVWANANACRMLGRRPDETVGHVLPGGLLAGERGSTALLTGRLPGRSAVGHDIAYFTFDLEVAARPLTVSIFRDLAEPRAAARTAVALAQTVAQLAGSSPTNEVLAAISRQAVEETRAVAAGISLVGDNHKLDVGGAYGSSGARFRSDSPAWRGLNSASAEDVIHAMTAGAIVIGSRPGKAVVLSDARSTWEQCPVMSEFARAMSVYDWKGAVCVPLAWESRVIGVLGVYLPAGMAGPSEAELAFCTTLADEAAIAVSNARLRARAGRAAALDERSRLARELHDSVSQALFAMTMHARAAELALVSADVDPTTPLSASVGQLTELAHGVLAEMRALIFELRPEALAEEGLVGALTKQAAALTAREQISITVHAPQQRVALGTEAEVHTYRIVSEALHNVVKHSRATAAEVAVSVRPGSLRVIVTDNGVGFDTGAAHDGRLGLSLMVDRAAAIGGQVSIDSRHGTDGATGTTVSLTVPIGARAD